MSSETPDTKTSGGRARRIAARHWLAIILVVLAVIFVVQNTARHEIHLLWITVIGHLNHAPVTHVYGQLVDMIRDRKLRSVTLNDIFMKPPSSN